MLGLDLVNSTLFKSLRGGERLIMSGFVFWSNRRTAEDIRSESDSETERLRLSASGVLLRGILEMI